METNTQFVEYLNIVNQAIGQHKDEFPYNKLISGTKNLLDDKRIGVAVYDGKPDNPSDYFTVQLRGTTFELVDHGKSSPDVEWKVPHEHLKDVIADPEEYIAHPAKLDLDWLETRLAN